MIQESESSKYRDALKKLVKFLRRIQESHNFVQNWTTEQVFAKIMNMYKDDLLNLASDTAVN